MSGTTRGATMTRAALIAAYLGSIVAAAWAITHVGTQYAPGAPHVLPVGFDLEAPSGVYLVGLTLVLRDLLQHRVSRPTMFALILVGAGIAATFSPAVAVASAAAFAVSETVDYGIYSLTEPRFGKYAAIGLSNAASLVVDSIAFLAVAFGSLAYVDGQIVGKAWATLAGLAAIWAINHRRQVVAA